ncbi:hypothetical protein PPNSA23_38040 [Phyllobacterium phragmitis]|uniref:Uncharacterized protein n=1 Tax=Phyllobacterium phragmitis TaxID=2670329 RepID=A0ABQ0H4M8_9HYPH
MSLRAEGLGGGPLIVVLQGSRLKEEGRGTMVLPVSPNRTMGTLHPVPRTAGVGVAPAAGKEGQGRSRILTTVPSEVPVATAAMAASMARW